MNAAWINRARSFLLATLVGVVPLCAAAQNTVDEPDWPGRVGRLVEVQGSARLLDRGDRQWIAATPNYPLTSGDHLVTDPGSRLELSIGSTQVRLDSATELQLRRIDDHGVVLQLDQGSVALRISSAELAAQVEVVTPEGRFRPREPGHYRIDRQNEASHATAWRGTLRFEGREQAEGREHILIVGRGQHAELWLQGPSQRLQQRWLETERDAFSEWVAQDERAYERSETARYVSPEMTGAEDLDQHGRWQTHPEYGGVWIPTAVPVDWAPYRSGHWAWIAPWGWTWVDSMRWGFAPFHYGRWVHWGRRWCWVPGQRVARPVFSPALVAWVGGSHGSIGVTIGGPVGWIPLGPRDVYHRWHGRNHDGWRDGRRDGRRDDRHDDRRRDGRVPTGPIMYTNQGVPGAVTTVAPDAFSQTRRVVPVVGRHHEDGGRSLPTRGREPTSPLMAIAPPAAPAGRTLAPQFPAPSAVPQPAPMTAPPVAVMPQRPSGPPVQTEHPLRRDGAVQRGAQADRDDEPTAARPQPGRRGEPQLVHPGHRAAVPQAQAPAPQPVAAPRPAPQPAPQPAAAPPVVVQAPPAAAPAAPPAALMRAPAPSPVLTPRGEAPRGQQAAQPAPRESRDEERRQRAPEQRGGMRERTQIQ
ncbi:hypothetical protein HLB44_17225 [Aquincola sp. S2]|uniref:FecR protein domain-containing protein n=1 Tax=Pseudaquabacterium terrae TaxID=2732868 RepID=A0ABX2EJB7_9BURK|nr:DUF6600 domain-containing protein [Aquabacterium terrae]NRF68736.1 hypothetical protein [Aquabacterium terrae]